MGMAAMVLLLAVSCKKENKNEGQGETKAMTFTAGISQSGSKTYADGYNLKWSVGDVININGAPFTLTEGENTASGKFDGTTTETGLYYAVYPYKDGNTVDPETGIATITLPAEQPFVEGTFAKDVAPMVAMTDDSKSFRFTNIFGVLKINVGGGKDESFTVNKIVLQSADPEEKLAGKGTVTIAGSGNEKLAITENGAKAITLTFAESQSITFDGNTTHSFVFVLPDGSLKHGFNVDLYDGDEMVSWFGTATDMGIESGAMSVATVSEPIEKQDSEMSLAYGSTALTVTFKPDEDIQIIDPTDEYYLWLEIADNPDFKDDSKAKRYNPAKAGSYERTALYADICDLLEIEPGTSFYVRVCYETAEKKVVSTRPKAATVPETPPTPDPFGGNIDEFGSGSSTGGGSIDPWN